MAAVGPGFREQAVLLGPRQSLLAIVTRPAAVAPASDEPAIVILNTGIVHRVGHNRMYVTLARELARHGRTVVRFDFSGIGDSEAREDGVPPLQACLEEIGLVLGWLEATHRMSRFILVGLCSGADHAVLYAQTDPRVTGLVLMDPTIPPTPRYYYHYVMQRLRRPQSWFSVLVGRSGLLRLIASHIRSGGRARAPQPPTLQGLQFSPLLRQCYKRNAERGIKVLAILTSVSARHSYGQQMRDAFPEAAATGGFRLEFFPESDHVFSADRDRTRLYGAITDWLGLS
jgi:pimeloyl-ACP methyl ester carboxylesterase